METNRQKDSFFLFSLDWDWVEVSSRALPKGAWRASLDLTWFSFPGTEELAAYGHMWIWWLPCILTNLSYYGKFEATDLNISRSVWVICMGTQYVAFQSWKGCYILCHPPFIELETDSQRRNMLDKELVGSKICVLFFSPVFFPHKWVLEKTRWPGHAGQIAENLGPGNPSPSEWGQ